MFAEAGFVPCADDVAATLLESTGWEAKPAIVMGRLGVDVGRARALLARQGGHLRRTLEGGAA